MPCTRVAQIYSPDTACGIVGIQLLTGYFAVWVPVKWEIFYTFRVPAYPFFPPFFSLLINGRWVPARIQPTRNEITTTLARCRSSPLPPSSPSLQSRAFELFDGARHTHEERKKIGRTQTVLPQSLSFPLTHPFIPATPSRVSLFVSRIPPPKK